MRLSMDAAIGVVVVPEVLHTNPDAQVSQSPNPKPYNATIPKP